MKDDFYAFSKNQRKKERNRFFFLIKVGGNLFYWALFKKYIYLY